MTPDAVLIEDRTGCKRRHLSRRRWCLLPQPHGKSYGGDLLTIWRAAASDVTGGALDTGHYLAEEAPQAVIEAFERFFV